ALAPRAEQRADPSSGGRRRAAGRSRRRPGSPGRRLSPRHRLPLDPDRDRELDRLGGEAGEVAAGLVGQARLDRQGPGGRAGGRAPPTPDPRRRRSGGSPVPAVPACETPADPRAPAGSAAPVRSAARTGASRRESGATAVRARGGEAPPPSSPTIRSAAKTM